MTEISMIVPGRSSTAQAVLTDGFYDVFINE